MVVLVAGVFAVRMGMMVRGGFGEDLGAEGQRQVVGRDPVLIDRLDGHGEVEVHHFAQLRLHSLHVDAEPTQGSQRHVAGDPVAAI